MNNLDKQYTDLLQDILDNGVTKSDRTETGTLSVFGRQIRHKMSEGFPLLTTKKMPFKTIVTELLWFLRGDTNIKFLVDNNCHIWDGDAYRNYEILMIGNPPEKILGKDEFIRKIKEDAKIEHSLFTFAQKWGELGPIYGKQWRSWKTVYDSNISKWDGEGENAIPVFEVINKHDQIANLINDLKTNPDSRRLMVNAWNVKELDSMVLPPCHYGFQVYTRELSTEERYLLVRKNYLCPKWDFVLDENGNPVTNPIPQDVWYDNYNIPRRAISLMWNQRSVDTFLGLPFNIASYGLLLEIIAKAVNMVPDELIGNLGDTHLYLNHIEQAKEQIGRELSVVERMEYYGKHFMEETESKTFDELCQIDYDKLNTPNRTREPYPLPTLKHMKSDEFYKSLSEDVSLFTHLDNTDFVVEGYQSHPIIKAPLSN
jgi:thymidylate synthase